VMIELWLDFMFERSHPEPMCFKLRAYAPDSFEPQRANDALRVKHVVVTNPLQGNIPVTSVTLSLQRPPKTRRQTIVPAGPPSPQVVASHGLVPPMTRSNFCECENQRPFAFPFASQPGAR
jgi:hypothetical protein